MRTSIKKAVSASAKRKTYGKEFTSQVYREIITPSQKKVSITLPNNLVGKTVEVFAFELHASAQPSKRGSTKGFWETFGSGRNSTISIEAIRRQAWRKY